MTYPQPLSFGDCAFWFPGGTTGVCGFLRNGDRTRLCADKTVLITDRNELWEGRRVAVQNLGRQHVDPPIGLLSGEPVEAAAVGLGEGYFFLQVGEVEDGRVGYVGPIK